MTMQDDLAARSHDIRWPQDFDPAKADLFAHNELAMNASCEQIWQHYRAAIKTRIVLPHASVFLNWFPIASSGMFPRVSA